MTRRIFFLLLSFSLAGAAWAKPQDKQDKDDYTRLARLSYIEGNVSYQHATDVDWAAASINLPLEPGDRIYTSPDGRAEIEFDDGSVYRLARNTDVEILSLREDLIQMRILVGLSTLIVSSDIDFEMNTPAAAFNAVRKGSYRFFVDENGDSDAIVRKGKLEAANNSFSREIDSGEMLHITLGSSGNPELTRYDRRDDWDEWNDRRNADLLTYGGRKYLPDTVYIGVSDLDRHGRWVEVDTYGSAWVPYSVGFSWSPYSVGRWCYRPLFGWTWVSYEPWGWLPYHYGSWYRSSIYGWCWLPGPAFSFNFWSPGLVTFYSGPGWISWCPLGPGDYYNVHHYHYNRGIYGHQLNQLARLHTRPQGNPFHRDSPGAFRTAPIDRFRNGSFGDRGREGSWANVDQPWRRGELVRDSLNIRPTSTSYRAAPDRQASQPGMTRQLPAVVRSNPAYNSRGQEHFTRITNPQIPSLPSRAERMRSIQEETRSGTAPRTNARVIQTPQRQRANSTAQTQPRERSNPAAENPSGNSFAEQGGRSAETPRRSRTSENSRENSTVRENSTPATRPDTNPPSSRQSTTGGRSESSAPEQKQLQRTPSESRPKTERSQPNNSVQPRSGTDGRRNSDSPAAAASPGTNNSRAYSSRQAYGSSRQVYSSRAYSAPQAASSRAYSTPQAETSPTYRAPQASRSRVDSMPQASTSRTYSQSRENSYSTYSAPLQSGSSFARSSGARSYSTPSYNRSSGNGLMSVGRSGPSFQGSSGAHSYSAPSFGRSGGSGSNSFGRSSGGGASGGFSGGSQRAPARSSSGSGGGRR
jgi:hypothetical protein